MNHPNGNVAGRMPVNDGLSAGTMNVSERQNDILTAARTKGKISVEGLAAAFAVTPQTICRDLNELCRRGLLTLIHGGAVPANTARNPEPRRGQGRWR